MSVGVNLASAFANGQVLRSIATITLVCCALNSDSFSGTREPKLRVAADVRRLGGESADVARVIVFVTNDSHRPVSGSFETDLLLGYRPSDTTKTRVDARIQEINSRGGHVCRAYPTFFYIPKSAWPDAVFSGHRLRLAPGSVWADSIDIELQASDFVDLPGTFEGTITLWAGRPGRSWREAKPLGSAPLSIRVP